MKHKLNIIAPRAIMAALIIAAIASTISARAADEPPTPEITAVYRDGNTLRVEVTTDGTASTADVDLAEYSDAQYITLQAADANGNSSETVRVLNPNFSTPTPESQPEPEPADEAIPETAFTPNGNGTVHNNATDADGKEFFTIQTKDEKIFYLIIDRQRGAENVYFLDTVTIGDLRSLADGGIPESSPSVEPTVAPPESATPTVETPQSNGTIVLIIIAAVAVGGLGFYFKILKPKQAAKQHGYSGDRDNSDYFNEEDDEIL